MTDVDPRRAIPGAARRGARVEADRAGLDALLIGVGADLRYLAGYEALPLERLTLLVLPAREARPRRSSRRGSRRRPRCRARRRRPVPSRSHLGGDRGPDARSSRAALRRRPAAGAAIAAVAVSDGLRAAFVLGLQRVLPGARFSLAAHACSRACGWSRTRTRSRCSDARRTAPTGSSTRSRPAGSSGAPRPTSRARSATGCVAEGHETGSFCDRRVGSQQRLAPPRGGDRVHPGRRARSSSTSAAPSGATAPTSRAPSGSRAPRASGPDEEFRACTRCCSDAQRAATDAVRPGVACEAIDAAARDRITAAGYGASGSSTAPGTGSGSRATRSRTWSRATASRWARDGVQRGARHLPRGPVRGADRGHRRLRAGRAGRRSTSCAARPARRPRADRRPAPAGPPGVSSADRSSPGRHQEPRMMTTFHARAPDPRVTTR